MAHRTLIARWLLVTALALGLTTAGVSAQGWPRYRRDAARTGAVEESLSFPLHRHWVYEPDRHPRPAWPDPRNEPHPMPFDYAPVPVVAGGVLYVGSTTDDTVRALDAVTAEPRWRFATGGPVRLAPDIYEGRAYVASDDGWLYCLEARTGALLWRFRAAAGDDMVLGNGRMISRRPLRSGVLVDDGVVYTTAGMWPSEGVVVYALEAETGAVIWKNDTFAQHGFAGDYFTPSAVAPQGYLAAEGDVLLVPTGRAAPAAFSRSDGRLLYYQPTHRQRAGAWVTIDAEHDIFINSSHSGDRAFSLSTGRARALRAFEMDICRYVPDGWLRAGEAVLIGGAGRITAHGDGQLPALPAIPHGGPTACAVYDTDRVWPYYHYNYYGTEHAAVHRRADADEAAEPEALWSAEVEGYVRRLAVADGRLYASTDDGRIYCFAPGRTPDAGAPQRVRPPAPGGAPAPGPLARETLARLAGRRVQKGYALVLGEPEPDLAQALAAATELHVLQVLGFEEAARAARERLLDSTHLYGSRIAVTHRPDDGGLPFPPYFANLVVGGPVTLEVAADEVHRVLRPAGGLWLPGPGWAPPDELDAQQVEREDWAHGVVLERGKLPGAFDWDSEEPADERLRWPLALSWFGGPGPARMVDRHSHGPTPIAANGRYFHVGGHHVIAVDAYNGTELWSRSVPYAFGTPQKFGVAPWVDAKYKNRAVLKSLAADDESVHLNFGSVCYRLDAQTGGQQAVYGEFRVPERLRLDGPARFEFDVVGNATRSGAVTLTPGPEGLAVALETRDPAVTGLDSWELFFDFRPPHRRADIYEPDDLDMFRVYVQARTGRPRPYIRYSPDTDWEPDDASARPAMESAGGAVEDGTAVRLFLPWKEVPAAAGRPPEEFAFTATLVSYDRLSREGDIRTHPFGTDNTAGTFNDGWPVFVLGDGPLGESEAPEVGDLAELPERALQWGRRPSRPAEAQDAAQRLGVLTGETRTTPGSALQRLRALTGQTRTVPASGLSGTFYRRGHGCGPVVTSSQMDFFRSGTLGLYDTADDSGSRHFVGVRPGCGTTVVPALGLLISSEASSGCTCSYNFQTSLALAPTDRRRNEDWAAYFEPVPSGAPVNRASVNLGAPGDRRDDDGRLWAGFPRPAASPLALPLSLDWDERLGPWRVNTDHTLISGTDTPWVYGSGIRGIRRLGIDLRFRGPEDSEGSPPDDPLPGPDEGAVRPNLYTVRLHFAELDERVGPGDRVFGVSLQGETVLESLDVVAEAGGHRRALVREFRGVPAERMLEVTFIPQAGELTETSAPILAGLDIVEERGH